MEGSAHRHGAGRIHLEHLRTAPYALAQNNNRWSVILSIQIPVALLSGDEARIQCAVLTDGAPTRCRSTEVDQCLSYQVCRKLAH